MKSKNKALALAIKLGITTLLTLMVGFTGVMPGLAATGIHVNPVDNLRSDFMMGADVSMLRQIEDSGGKFYVNGEEKDALTILKDHGVNWIRLRIWNDPTDENGEPLGGGNNDLARTVEIAARAKSMGFKFFLDFHYSDWWADPGKQNMPKAWVDLDAEALGQAVYDYTADVIQTLAAANAMPDMVQIGNEVNGGMMWPAGKTWAEGSETIGGYDGFADLLKMGIQAVRDTDPNNSDPAARTRIAIHLAEGGDNELFRTVFDELTARNVDFDVIGLSYYSYWHGTLEELKANMNDISERYQKDVVIAETAYAATLRDQDGLPNLFAGEREQYLGGYKASVLGQATAMRDLIEAVTQVPNGRGLGIFYWEPAWIAVDGAGWQTGAGNAWENQAMFGFNGEALSSMNVFNLVKPDSGGGFVPATITQSIPSKMEVPLGETPELPATVKALFTDDSIRDVPVTWEAIDPAMFETGGEITWRGTVDDTELAAILNITVSSHKNYLLNPGFETGSFAPWVVEGDTSAADVSNEASNVYTGKFAVHYWLGEPFAFTVSQTVTDLPDGKYAVSAWMHGGGGEDTLQLSVSDCGGEPATVDIVNTGWLVWNTPVSTAFDVTDGSCTVTLTVSSPGGSWAFFDDVELYQVE